MHNASIGIVIPAYKPGMILVDLARELIGFGYGYLIVVNDGSGPGFAPIFSELRSFPGVTVLEHAVNLGKGQALKTAFNHLLLHHPESLGVVTVDADGQHRPADVEAVAAQLRRSPHALVLGSRSFQGEVPLRSRFGNTLTRWVFRFLMGRGVTDTQTGLRGIPTGFLHELLRIKSTGYEFELDMLVQASARHHMRLHEVPIATVYEPGNPTSHFNPVKDSLRIYFVFFRFLMSSLMTFLVDSVVFAVAHWLTGWIFASLVCARVVAGAFNFVLGRTMVFRSKGQVRHESIRFATLVILLMSLSYVSVVALSEGLGMAVLPAKVLSESLLFFLSFAAQRTFVFRPPSPADADAAAEEALKMHGAAALGDAVRRAD